MFVIKKLQSAIKRQGVKIISLGCRWGLASLDSAFFFLRSIYIQFVIKNNFLLMFLNIKIVKNVELQVHPRAIN